MSANRVVTALQRYRYDVETSTDEFEFDPSDRVVTPTGAKTTMSLTRAGVGATIGDRVGTTSAGDAATIAFETSERV